MFQKLNEMSNHKLFEDAKRMFINNASRGEVMQYLEEQGIPANESGQLATNAYTAIRDMREQMMSGGSGGGGGSTQSSGGGGINGALIIGILLLVGGIVATMASNTIWYGAMIVGVISIFKGLAGGGD